MINTDKIHSGMKLNWITTAGLIPVTVQKIDDGAYGSGGVVVVVATDTEFCVLPTHLEAE